MTRRKRWMFLLLAGSLVALPLSAQSTPTMMNYQGRLTDNTPGQNPIDGAVPMEFKIYGSSGGADLLWSESWGGVTVSDGIFSVLLGSNGSALPASVFTGGATRYLEIVVNGEILTPRQQLGAAGWAHQADRAADVECVGCVQSGDIQDSTITSGDVAADTLTAADLAANSVGASELAANAVGDSELNNGQSFNVNGLTVGAGGLTSTTVSGTSIFGAAQGGDGNGKAFYGVGGKYGVHGLADGSAGDTFGVYGRANDTGLNSYGVYGAGGDYGVFGDGEYGVYGAGTTYALYGQGGNYGVYAYGTTTGVDASGNQYGVSGYAYGSAGVSYGVAGFATNPGGDAHYGGFFSAQGATSNYGIGATGTTAAAYFTGTVIAKHDSLTNDPQIEVFEVGNDYARIKLHNTTSSHSWDIAGYANDTTSAAWLNFWSQGYGDVLKLRGDGFVWFNRFGSGYTNTLCSSAVGFGWIGNCSSSRRYKTDLLDLGLGLKTVLAMRPVTFRWIRDGVADFGFVAEEMDEVDPILVTRDADGEPESVRYRQLTAVLARAIQQQQAQIEELRARLAALED